MLLGSYSGLLGTALLHKHLLLLAALIFVCAMAPMTPNMIVESAGVQAWYFIMMAKLWVLVGGV